MKVFGSLSDSLRCELESLLSACARSEVVRSRPARSSMPFPQSTDLEIALAQIFVDAGFEHHVRFAHPRTRDEFEYDFWRARDGTAIEIMGYRADDEIYKNILKFHVHEGTSTGVVFVPRYKWISGRRTDTNYSATVKALAFADSYMNVEALVAITYDWTEGSREGSWKFKVIKSPADEAVPA